MDVSYFGSFEQKVIVATCLVILFDVGMKPMVTAAKARRRRMEESILEFGSLI